MIYKLTPVNTRELIAPDGEVVEIPIASNTSFRQYGAFMPIIISPSGKISEQLPTHDTQLKTFNCNALIDTGAAISVISSKVVEELSLLGIGFQNITSVHSIEERPVYFGRLTFPWGTGMEISLVSCELQGFDCLIGRDVLRFWHMTYDGFNGEITICD